MRNHETVIPEVVRTQPRDGAHLVAPDTTIEIEFSVRMHPTYTQEALSIQPPVAGAFTWSTDERMLVFTPAEPLPLSQHYVVSLDDTAESADGVPLAGLQRGFTTLDVALLEAVLSPLR